MNDELSAPAPGAPDGGILWPKWIVVTLLAYWAAFAVVAPVMNYDSQTYNLARLYIAHEKGLFGNHRWSNLRQVIFPWTFDAIHYPFLFLRWGYCLPSFACLLGLLIIVYRLVAAGSARRAWWCCLSLLALPTLVFQSVCTKNDVAVVFALGCWYYAWRLWRDERREVYLLFMALALSFAAGAKTTGVPFYGVLGIFTLWQLRASPRSAVRFAGWMAVFLVLFGSVEIYLNNERAYHAPLGPPAFVSQHQNRDGVAGGVANLIRYGFGNMNVGVDAANPATPVAGWLENGCREFLGMAGLVDVGYRSDYGEVDANMRFLKGGAESETDFGPVGALALLAGVVFVLALPRSDPVWKLAAAGLATLALTAYTVAWMMWNARFLMLSFCLLTLALTLWTLRLDNTNMGRFLRSAFLALVVFSAVVYPLCSFNRKPSDLRQAFMHRSVYETQERRGMLEIMRDLRARAKIIGSSPLLLHAGTDSWVVCFMELRGLNIRSAPVINRWALIVASLSRRGMNAQPVYVLTVNEPVEPDIEAMLTLVKKYAEPGCALYEWQPPTPLRGPIARD